MHSLSNIDEINRVGTCSLCGVIRIILRDSKKKKLNSKWRCATPHRASNNRFSYPYRIYKKDYCEKCGFVAEHKVQLDVDHIDGNNKNNKPSNLQTLCSNCHRLKTYISKDGTYQKSILVVPCPPDRDEAQTFGD